MAITINGSYGISGSNVLIGTTPVTPASSARAILAANPDAPSGYYWIQFPATLNNQPLLTYCDMTGSESGSSIGGWMKIDDAWTHQNWNLLYSQENPVAGNYYWAYGGVTKDTSKDMSLFWNPSSTDGGIRAIRFRMPSGSRGIRVTNFRGYSVNGPDHYAYNDWLDNSAPTRAQIVSAGDGNGIGLGSNYSSFGIYLGDGAANGKRVWRPNWNGSVSEGGWSGEINGGWFTLGASSFVQWDDIGNDADRLIIYQSDGDTEYVQLYFYTIWIR